MVLFLDYIASCLSLSSHIPSPPQRPSLLCQPLRHLQSVLSFRGLKGDEKSVLPPWPQGEGATKSRKGFFFHPLSDHEKTVLIVGAGGAGKAAKAAAEALGYKTTVVNRTQYGPEIKPLSSFPEEFRKADIVIYNLPVRIPEVDMLTEEDLCTGQAKVILEANHRNPSFDNGMKK